MQTSHTIKKLLIYTVWALLNAFIIASAITLVYAARHESNIFVIQSAPEINIPLLLIVTSVLTGLFILLFLLKEKVYRWITPLSITLFACTVSMASKTARPYFSLVLCTAAVGMLMVMKEVFPDRQVKLLEGGRLYIIVLILTLFTVGQVAFAAIARHLCYSSSTFDLGIFAQMYRYMSTDLTLNTTVERNILMSHLSVHFSPIYYLLLPFFLISPTVECLLIMQAAVCFSGVIPLLLMCRRWRYSETVTLGLSLAFLLFPAFTGGLFYDFHENAFLVPLLLWALYFLDANNTVGMAVSALLILCVKEDAGLYVIFLGLYALFNKRVKRYNAIGLLVMGVGGFIGVTSLVEAIGEGIKVSRYNIFLTAGQDSLTDVVINVIRNPAFFFSKLLNEDKLLFLVQMLAPLMFLPIRTRRLSDWLLVAPLIIVHLASDYAYQADIHYQYVFGTGALLVFLCAKNIRYCKEKTKTAAAAAIAGAIILTGSMTGKYEYIEILGENYDKITATNQALELIPEDAAVFSTTYFTPHLFRCKELYMYPAIYNKDSGIVPDYVVLDSRSGVVAEYFQLYTYWLEEGYEVISTEGYATILKSPDNS